MIGNSIPEYVFIRASIAALRLVAPASILYLAVAAYTLSFPISLWLGIFAVSEASFFLFTYLFRRRHLQLPPTCKPPQLSRVQRQELFYKCRQDLKLSAGSGINDLYPRGWFLPLEKPVRREDLIDWLLWALFSCERKDALMDEWKEELEGYVAVVEEKLNERFEPGSENGVKGMRLTLDPVEVVHRPLVWYSIVCLVDTSTTLNLLYLGFSHYSSQKWFETFPPRPVLSFLSHPTPLSTDILLPYWYRPHKSVTKLPILFIHGIGIGLHPYLPFFRSLIAQDPDIGILLIELLPISMHMTSHPIPPRPLIISALNSLLDSLNINRIVLVAHSYGTFISSCILRFPAADSSTSTHPPAADGVIPMDTDQLALLHKVAHVLLIDPIPILLHLPQISYNFLHRPPRRAAEWQLWYFASTDGDVARTLGRSFFWEEGVVWRDDLQRIMRGEVEEVGDGRIGGGIADVLGHTEETVRKVGVVEGSKRRSRKDGRARNLAVVLAGKDQIIPAESLREYLTEDRVSWARWTRNEWAWDVDGLSSPAGDSESSVEDERERRGSKGGNFEVLFYPDLDHAMVFDTSERRKGMLDVLFQFVRDI